MLKESQLYELVSLFLGTPGDQQCYTAIVCSLRDMLALLTLRDYQR